MTGQYESAQAQAHEGRGHWLQERIAAVAMLPLSLWASFFMFRVMGRPRHEVVGLLGQWRRAAPMALLACLAARHTQLGLEVVIGDYLRGASRKVATAATRALCAVFALSVVISLARLMCARQDGEQR